MIGSVASVGSLGTAFLEPPRRVAVPGGALVLFCTAVVRSAPGRTAGAEARRAPPRHVTPWGRPLLPQIGGRAPMIPGSDRTYATRGNGHAERTLHRAGCRARRHPVRRRDHPACVDRPGGPRPERRGAASRRTGVGRPRRTRRARAVDRWPGSPSPPHAGGGRLRPRRRHRDQRAARRRVRSRREPVGHQARGERRLRRAEAVFTAVERMGDALLDETGARGNLWSVGLGMPGPVAYDGRARPRCRPCRTGTGSPPARGWRPAGRRRCGWTTASTCRRWASVGSTPWPRPPATRSTWVVASPSAPPSSSTAASTAEPAGSPARSATSRCPRRRTPSAAAATSAASTRWPDGAALVRDGRLLAETGQSPALAAILAANRHDPADRHHAGRRQGRRRPRRRCCTGVRGCSATASPRWSASSIPTWSSSAAAWRGRAPTSSPPSARRSTAARCRRRPRTSRSSPRPSTWRSRA